MTKLLEFRAKYPQYDNVSDEVLADKLHKKYYNDVPFDVFANKIGLKESGILAVLKGGTERFISSGQTALESLIGSPEEAAIKGEKRQREISERIAPGANLDKVTQAYKEKGLLAAAGEAVGQIPEAVAEMAPAIGATMAGAAIGQAAIPIPVAGALIGAAVPSLITRYGGNIEAQAAAQQAEGQPVDINRAAAFGAAVPQTAIDTFANAFPVMGKAAVAKILGPAVERALARGSVADAERIAQESLIKRARKGLGENLAVQGLAQPTQVMLTRLQAGQDLLSPEALRAYGEAAYMATLISPVGAVGGIRERGQARQELSARDARLDTARQTLVEKIDAEKPTPDAPDPSMSAATVQRLLGVKLSEAKEIRRALSERGDLVPGTEKGETYKLYLNRDRLPKAEEAKPEEETTVPPAAPEQAITGEQLLGNLTERSPEELAADAAAAAEPTTTEPTLRPNKEKEPAKLKLTSPESPVYQNALSVLETLHTTDTPITPVTFREAIKQLGVKPIHAEPLLNAFTRDGILSKPDENKVRTFSREAVEGVKPFQPVEEVSSGITSSTATRPDFESTGRGVEPPVSGDRTEIGAPEVGIPGGVGDTGEPAAVRATPERRGEPALKPVEPVASFTTAKGSEYVVHEDGTTTRNKAARNEPGHEGDSGLKARSVRTVYVDENAAALSAAGLIGAEKPRVIIKNGKATLVTWEENLGKWGAAPSSRDIPIHDTPAVGRYPLELWGPKDDVPGYEAYSGMHAGNEITEIKPVVKPTEPPVAPRPQTIPEGERVPYNAQPIAPDVFVPTPEQAKLTVEAEAAPEVTKLPEEARARDITEEAAPPEEGVSQRYDSVSDALRAGDLGEALYRLRTESSGKGPLSWLADKLMNVINIKDDRSELIKAETERVARERGIDQETDPATHARIAQEVERAVMSDTDLTKYKYDYPELKPEVARMVEANKRAQAEPQKPENLYRPYVLETPKAEPRFKKGAFGGAKVFVEGNKNVKGQHKAVIDRLQKEGKLAEYNPKTNTFYFTEAGLTDRVILHEMVHSATVDVIKKFVSGKLDELTTVQRDAAADIMSIYESTKKALGEKFKNAYENPYEFVSYAMTNEGFQRALSYLNAPKTARMKLRSAWDSFTIAVAKMFGLDKSGRLKAMEEPSPTRELKPGEGIKRALGRERAEAADTLDNALLQVLDSVGSILTVPKAGVEVEPLAARKSGRFARRRRAQAIKQITSSKEPLDSTRGTFIPATSKQGMIAGIKSIFKDGWYDKAAFNLQNHKRYFAVLQEALDRAGLTVRGTDKATNVYELMTGASGKQEINENRRVTPLVNRISEANAAYANKRRMSPEDAAEHLGTLRMAMNELEKRVVKFLLHVPLNDKPILTLNGKPISPAAYRDALIDYLVQNKDLVSNGEAKQIRAQLENLVQKYAELGGKSRDNRVPSSSPDALDVNSKHYQVVGYDNAKLNAWRRVYAREMRKYGPEMKAVFDALDAANAERIAMEREGKFWTQPVDNLKEFYGYEHYVPYKGMEKGTSDATFDLDSTVRAGRQFQQLEDRAMGRTTEINNPILQVVQDLHRASVRSSTDGITQSLVNLINSSTPLVKGKLVERVSFQDKFNGVQRKDLSKYNVFFHQLPDGSTEVYALDNKRLIDGLNGFNTELGSLTRDLSKFTNFMGKMHTFYNLGFAPYNFVRDTLTNAYNAAGRFGITAAPKIIGAVAKNMLESGLFYRAAKISYLYQKGDIAAIKNMKGQFAKDAYEFLVEEGGRGAFKSSFNMGEIEKATIGPDRLLSRKNVDKLFSTWADMFEFVSRASTYGVVKKELIAEAKAKGKNVSDPAFTKGVKEQAASFTKNLFNYEQVGKYGRQLGAYYMFMRPSLTSAVRVMDVFRPIFETAESAMARGPELLKITDPTDPNYAKAQAARAEYAKSFAKEQRNALLLSAVIGGMGMVAYNMAMQAADTDDKGRNKVATDDPALWTRALRFPMKFAGEGNEFLQIPWGFGPGAFAALGAQFAILMHGNQTLKEFGENMIPIVMDSFLPLPTPRFSPIDEPSKFVLDSVLPTSVRPLLEYTVNMDGLGRQIYNDRINKYGDAYSAGESVPEILRDFSAEVMNMTAGWDKPLEIDPKSVNFYVNTYIDAVGKFASAIHGLTNMMTDDKNFDVKTDLPLTGSFVGKRSSVDARKFSDLRDEMEQKKQFISAYRNRPQFEEYLQTHPNDLRLVSLYDNAINGRLKQIQSVEKQVNSGVGVYGDLSRGARQEFLKKLRNEKESIMGNFVESAEALKRQADLD